MKGSSEKTMHFTVAAAMTVLILSSLYNHGVFANNIVMGNKMEPNRNMSLFVSCDHSMNTGGHGDKAIAILWGEQVMVHGPLLRDPVHSLPVCKGRLEDKELGYRISFTAYDEERDHVMCGTWCRFEARASGWYVKNVTSAWEVAEAFFQN